MPTNQNDECPSHGIIREFLRANPNAFERGTVEEAAGRMHRMTHAIAAIFQGRDLLGCEESTVLTWAILMRAHADHALRKIPAEMRAEVENYGLALSAALFSDRAAN